jgi:hypothetical protein
MFGYQNTRNEECRAKLQEIGVELLITGGRGRKRWHGVEGKSEGGSGWSTPVCTFERGVRPNGPESTNPTAQLYYLKTRWA